MGKRSGEYALMVDWVNDSPDLLRQTHRKDGRGRGALPPGVQVNRIKGALVVAPSGRTDLAGTLVWWHGGGFVAGHPLRALAPAAWIAAEANMRAILPLWPLAPETQWPAQADHARRWCRRIDGPLAVGGDSAGGALALACADLAAALVLAYPALGAPPGRSVAHWGQAEDGLDSDCVTAMYARLGAPDIAQDWTPGLPPCLLLSGDREALADDRAVLAQLGSFESHITEGAGHGFLRDAGVSAYATQSAQFAGQWLDSIMRTIR